MPLLFEMPGGIRDDMEQALTAVQTAHGKTEGFGKWQDTMLTPAYLSVALGSTWVMAFGTIAVPTYRSMLIGPTLLVSFYFGSTLTTATGTLRLRLPQAAVVGGPRAAVHMGTCYLNDNGTAAIGVVQAIQGLPYVAISKVDGSNFAGPTILVGGQLACEVVI